MSNDRFSIIPAVWVIVKDSEGKIFMLRRANTGWRDGHWTVPAGHVEHGEGPTSAAIRELREEAGLTVEAARLTRPIVYFYPEDGRINERVSIFFSLTDYEGEPINAEPHKADKAAWFSIDVLPDKIPPLLRRAIMDDANGDITYSDRYYDDAIHKELLQ